MTGLGEQLETIITEGIESYLGERNFKDEVESALEDHDFSDEVKSAIRDEIDVDDAVEKAMNDYDFSDAINDAVRDYEWWDEIEVKAKDEIETCVDNKYDDIKEAVLAQVKEHCAALVSKEVVRGMVAEIIAEMKAAAWQRIKTAVAYPFVWTWNKVKF
jgi:DNA primase large subunit